MIKIITVCGNGSGSSLIMEMFVKDVVIDELGWDATVEHQTISSPVANDTDFVISGLDLIDEIKCSVNTKKIGLLNVVNKQEIKEKLLAAKAE